MSDEQSQISADRQAVPRRSPAWRQLSDHVRDETKAREIAERNPGTIVTVNGASAYVPEKRWDERLFGLKLY